MQQYASQAGRAAQVPRAEKLLRVGLYDLDRTLGKGNFAIVKLGQHKLTHTKVAVKIVNKRELDAENLNKISREIDIMRQLSHKNIIQLYQVMESDTFMYIITEFAAQGEIFDWLVENKKMTEPQAARTFSQILNAVNYCHLNKVVHRDLKAENLLLDQDGNIKEHHINIEGQPGCWLDTWCGSPPYAAPELFEGKQYNGPAADVWSLGVILYVLVSGSLPFDGQNLQELRARVVSCQYRIPFFLSSDCEALLRGLLVLDPARRLSLPAIARHRWLVSHLPGPAHAALLADLHTGGGEAALEPCERLLGRAARIAGRAPAEVRAALQQNSCDDLSALYRLLAAGQEEQAREGGQAPHCPAPSPTCPAPLTEVYTEVEPSPGGGAGPRAGRRHTLGPASQGPVPLMQSPPFPRPAHTILPQTNLPAHLPLVSHQPHTEFSVKNQDLLRAPELMLPTGVPLGRRASDCGVYSSLAGSEAGEEEGGTGEPGEVQPVLEQAGPRYFTSSSCEAGARAGAGVGAGRRTTPSPDSPRKRRTGLMTVLERPPEIAESVLVEVEGRIAAQAGTTPRLPLPLYTAPPSPALSPARRPTQHRAPHSARVSSLKEPHSLQLSTERFSPVRRLSEGGGGGAQLARSGSQLSWPSSSTEQSPCEIRALQEEYRQLNQESGCRLSLDSGSSGYHSPGQFLLPPTPPGLPSLRRASESSVLEPVVTPSPGHTDPPDLAAMYEDMYSGGGTGSRPGSRRSSYPNSPSHTANSSTREKQSLTAHLQKLCLQQRITETATESSGLGVRFKGSITQGVPSLAATTPTTTPALTPVTTPKHIFSPPDWTILAAGPDSPSATTFDVAFSKQMSLQLWGSNYARSDDLFQLRLETNPEISVTDVMGDEIKVVLSEPMDQ